MSTPPAIPTRVPTHRRWSQHTDEGPNTPTRVLTDRRKEDAYTASESTDVPPEKTEASNQPPRSTSTASTKDMNTNEPTDTTDTAETSDMSKKKAHEKPPITKKSKSRRFKIFNGHKEKEAESATDDIYEDVKFFVNSTSILLTPREKFAEKATVTRLSVADHNKFLALIDVNNTGNVIVTEMDGVVQNTFNLTAPIEVVVLDDNRVAVLHGQDSLQVAILKRGEEEVKETKAMIMDISVKDVTGFD